MRIGIAQIETRAGDLERTCERIVAYSRQASEQGVELLVFPMAALTGPLPVEYTELEGFLTDLRDALDDLSERVACPCLVPVVWDMDGDPLPEAMLVEDGEVAPLKFLAYLSSLGDSDGEGDEAGQAGSWGPAPDLPVIKVGDVNIGIAFTYDDLDDFLDYDLGVDAVVYLAGYGFALDDPSSALGAALAENRYLRDAQDMDAWVVGVGSLGGYGTQVFTGSSFVATPWGEVAKSAPAFEEEMLVCDLDPKATGPLPNAITPEVYNRPLHLWQSLVVGLKGYVTADGMTTDAVVRLDGSIQSLLLAVLATDALGPTHVHALVAPLPSGGRLAWSREVARNLRIDATELTSAGLLPRDLVGGDPDEALVDDLVEVRLASLARSVHGIVLGAWDKTGLALEIAGSRAQAAELMPFGDVYRSDLLELVRLRNAISPAIPLAAETSYDVPPLPGLGASGASREERLREVDLVLAGHLEGERSLSELVDHGSPRGLAQVVLRRLDETGRARTGRVLYLMVTSRTLFDARRPLGLVWHDRYREPSERINDQDVWERLRRMGEQLIGGGYDQGPSGAGGQAGGNEVRDVLGYLRDFSQGGDRRGGQSSGGSEAQEWQNPFSDN